VNVERTYGLHAHSMLDHQIYQPLAIDQHDALWNAASVVECASRGPRRSCETPF
jgi:hypothetical protein